MKSVFEFAQTEYEKLEKLAEKLSPDESAEELMCSLDMLLQTALFSAALAGGIYLSGESGFLSQIVKHGDILREYNRHFGAGLKKTVTWEDLIFLPGPGKRQLQEALELEALRAAAPITAACRTGTVSARALEGQIMAIASCFAKIDEAERGDETTEVETGAAGETIKRLFKQILSE